MAEKQPTAEQIRAARHKGFNASIKRLPEDRRSRISAAYLKQDARREAHIEKFQQGFQG